MVKRSKLRRRIKCAAIILFGLLLVAAGALWRFWASRYVPQWQLLGQVVELESAAADGASVQTLGSHLAILGRDNEVRGMDLHPEFDWPPLEVDAGSLKLNAVPWQIAFRQIAVDHRLIMIMEDHLASKHREMIGATLPILREAGFTHYAVEAIGESQAALASRGYPVVSTGYYTSDPQFGNVLRRALALEFDVLGYDFRPFGHEWREDYAASELAELLQSDPATRLVVHAGHAHVLKHETDLGQRWLASLLWEKTGIEPFTIWQWSEMYDGHEYRAVAEQLGASGTFDEPVLLMPPPTTDGGLRDVPRVDAILVHPPDQSVSPGERTVLFPESMQRAAGRWIGDRWPVVVAAYKEGELATAIPLDQVMLREPEQDFLLWIPAAMDYDIRVFDQQGSLDCVIERDQDAVTIRLGD